MKTKLTLTVQKRVIDRAKRYARRSGKSISQIFEELFEQSENPVIKTEAQHAAQRLLETLEGVKQVETLSDKELIRNYVARKYS